MKQIVVHLSLATCLDFVAVSSLRSRRNGPEGNGKKDAEGPQAFSD